MRSSYNGLKMRRDVISERTVKEWYVNGELHRLDGPAIEYYYDDDKYWHISGIWVRNDFKELLKLINQVQRNL